MSCDTAVAAVLAPPVVRHGSTWPGSRWIHGSCRGRWTPITRAMARRPPSVIPAKAGIHRWSPLPHGAAPDTPTPVAPAVTARNDRRPNARGEARASPAPVPSTRTRPSGSGC